VSLRSFWFGKMFWCELKFGWFTSERGVFAVW